MGNERGPNAVAGTLPSSPPGPPRPVTIDLGCGFQKHGAIGVDLIRRPCVDLLADLTHLPLPFKDASVHRVEAHNVLEHLPWDSNEDGDILFRLFAELHRIIQPGGTLLIEVPHVGSRGSWGDPRHRRFFNRWTLRFFSEPAEPMPAATRFRSMRTWVDREFDIFGVTEWHLEQHAPALYRLVCRLHVGRPRHLYVEFVR